MIGAQPRCIVYQAAAVTGLLPLQERREIERALHDGDLWAVAATNALELGVDVGSLDVTLHLGFPGDNAAHQTAMDPALTCAWSGRPVGSGSNCAGARSQVLAVWMWPWTCHVGSRQTRCCAWVLSCGSCQKQYPAPLENLYLRSRCTLTTRRCIYTLFCLQHLAGRAGVASSALRQGSWAGGRAPAHILHPFCAPVADSH